MDVRRLRPLSPTETFDLDSGLSLAPRLKVLLTFFRSDPSVKPIDEWQLKSSLLDFLKPSLASAVPDDDLVVVRSKDLKKRRRDDPVASGTLYVRDLSFLRPTIPAAAGDEEEDGEDERRRAEAEAAEKRFVEWRKSLVGRLDGMELNIMGVKFRLSAEIPASDDFESVKRSWEDIDAFNAQLPYYSRGARQLPRTIVLGGVPSRWFAEPRVSSKPSVLVTHSIFSGFGELRNLYVAEDDDVGEATEEGRGEGLVSGLHCKIWLQHEKYEDFYCAMKVLCGRSMQKQGSRLKVDYDVTLEREGFCRSLRLKPSSNQAQESGSQMPALARDSRRDDPRLPLQVRQSRFDAGRPKRFRE